MIEELLKNFLSCWQYQEWTKILRYTRTEWFGHNWENNYNMDSNFFEAFFGWKSLKRWDIKKQIIDEDKKKSYEVVIVYLFYNKMKTKIIRPVINYKSNFKYPTEQEWAVMPFSCLEEFNFKEDLK